MCLVSYIPFEKGYLLTSNRDEAPQRAAKEILLESIGGRSILYPADSKGGTWIALSDRGEVRCALNGAFVKHKHEPPYKMSRGKMLLDSFIYPDGIEFMKAYKFTGIEPFTMILVQFNILLEFRWDGYVKYIEKLNTAQSHLWSSCTLYPPGVQQMREKWFYEDLSGGLTGPSRIFNIHESGGKKDLEIGFVMNRDNKVKTVSITQVNISVNNYSIRHKDLENQMELIRRIPAEDRP